ncbi:Protein dennd6a [Tritrichomonas musculus]|uniref:Protein dennd6a n=1 Tax=Tritrichomonas musculus TaxID=1915356 RepID=A0ABR2L6L7_9EUKA
MSHFFDAVCLVKFNREKGAYVSKFYPNNFNFLHQEDTLSICSIPETQTDFSNQQDALKKSITIFSTSIDDKNCYVLSFLYTNTYNNIKEPNSIVILSHKLIASEIFKMLLDVRAFLLQLLIKENEQKKFVKKNQKNQNIKSNKSLISCNCQNENEETCKKASIPEIVFEEVWRCTQLCAFDDRTLTFTVVTPFQSFKVVLGNEHITYSQFDPNFWLIPQTNLYVIWRALMTNRGILIIGDSPSQVSCTVYSILSLAAPLKYCEPYIAYTRLGDPRFAEIITNQSQKWKVVGTTNMLLAERCKQFAVVGLLSPIGADKYHEIDPDFLQQKFLNEKNTGNPPSANNEVMNINSNNFSYFDLRKFNFFGLRPFNNRVNSFFNLQLTEHSKENSQSSSPPSSETFRHSMCCYSLRKATNKMMALIEFKLNKKIEQDIYFDVLGKKMREEDFFGIFVASKSSQQSQSNKTSNNSPSNINQNELKYKNSSSNVLINRKLINNDVNDNNPTNHINNSISVNRNLNNSNNNVISQGMTIIKNNDENNDAEEINMDQIASELSHPAQTSNSNIQIGKIKCKPLIKNKALSLNTCSTFDSHSLSLDVSKISFQQYNLKKKLHPKIQFFTTKDAMRLQDSLTFKDWRKNIMYRQAFRESFLSMMPVDALKERNKGELVIIKNALINDISQKFNKDMHMMAVAESHIRIVRNRLNE